VASNGLTIASNSADIEFTDGVDTYGYKYAKTSQVVETRGSAFVGQIATGGTTYQDAEPFKRKVYDNFSGGMGQESDNKTFGGTGIGGDDSKYFYGDCYTLRGGYLLPGMARNLIYNTVSATTKTPISSGLDPLGGDEMEVPRGVVPTTLYSATPKIPTSFTTGSSGPTVTNVRILLQFKQLTSAGVDVYGILADATGLTTLTTFVGTVPAGTSQNYTGFKWVTLNNAGITLSASTTYQWQFYCNATNFAAIGCYVGASNQLNPYFQLMTSATPFKYWANPLIKMEQILNGTTYINAAITNSTWFNTALTNSGGTTPAASPEVTLTGTYMGSIVFNNLLYISTTTACYAWDSVKVAANTAAPSAGPDALVGNMGSPVAWGNYIYFTGGTNNTAIYKWTGVMPAVLNTNLFLIVSAGTIGSTATTINKLFFFQGNLWVIKPEGLFQLYIDPVIMDTNPGNTPRIVPVVTDLPSSHQDTGKWAVVHQGMIYFNYRDRIYQVTPGTGGPPQVTVLALPQPWYNLSYYHYVNGITSDGVNLYVSWNNLGVFAYANQTWHPITEFYETVGGEGVGSGLRWLPNPTSAPDYLFCGDFRTIIQLPVPNAAAPYTSQVYQNHQNKCGYLITSAWDGDLAEVQKYIHSLVMRAVPSGFSYKVSAVAYQSGNNASFKTLLLYSFWDGLVRDNWISPTSLSIATPLKVSTTRINSSDVAVANTLAPACWVYTDFNNAFYSSEKLAATTTNSTTTPATTDVLTNPPKFVKTAFIIYFWNPTAGQQATANTGTELMAIDSLVVKYQPPLDYIASYQITVDFRSEASGTKAAAKTRTPAQIDADAEWLRSKTGQHSPVQVTMKLNSATTKTFLAFLQNPTTTYGRASEQAKGLVVGTKSLNIISVQAEYESV
jgi:hypothetical protein